MGKRSVKQNKTIYQLSREAAGLTREAASDLIGFLSPDRIERIESGKVESPDPYDVLAMSEVYGDPTLCNHYCTHMCKIGEKYARQIEPSDLPQMTLSILASLRSVTERRDRMIEISSNGQVNDDEIEDFVRIQNELEEISATVDALRYWTEKMLSDGRIDEKKYKAIKAKLDD